MTAWPTTSRTDDAVADSWRPRAVVVFSGRAELKWLRILRPGYRHCFVAVEGRHGPARGWVLYNPLSVGTQVDLWAGMTADHLARSFTAQGYDVVLTDVAPLGRRTWGWRPYTCVEAVKRVLGLRAPAVWTPWQLKKYLKNHNKGKNTLTRRGG